MSEPLTIFQRHLLIQKAQRHPDLAPLVKSLTDDRRETPPAAPPSPVAVVEGIHKRIDAMVTADTSYAQASAAYFTAHPAEYDRYRKASAQCGGLPPAPTGQAAVVDTPTWALCKQMARERIAKGERGKSELELITTIWRERPDLYERHRREAVQR